MLGKLKITDKFFQNQPLGHEKCSSKAPNDHWPQVCSPQGFQPLFLSQHWPYFQYILLQVLQNHLATYERALIIPLVHVQPGFQVRRIKDDWQTFPKAMTKACKTWVFFSVWQYNNFSITLKKPTYIRCSLKRSILITCCLVHQQCTPTSSKLRVSQHGVHFSCEANSRWWTNLSKSGLGGMEGPQ